MCVLLDIDECTENRHQCHVDATCNNTQGSYNCSCHEGYNGNGYNCTDIKECRINENDCDKNAICTNTKGSYNCSCNNGYNGNGYNCTGKQYHPWYNQS